MIGPKRTSNINDQVAPETIGETTTGSTSSAMNIWRPGSLSRNSWAIASPNTSSKGSAMAMKISVWISASHSR